MCLFTMPSMPSLPPAPPSPPPAPVRPAETDPAVKAARADARRRAAGLQGYRSTIATSGLGLQAAPTAATTAATTALKTLLGQ